MLHDANPMLQMGSGPSRPVSTRLKVAEYDRLTALLASTGGTSADLIRRLVHVHLDAMDARGASPAVRSA